MAKFKLVGMRDREVIKNMTMRVMTGRLRAMHYQIRVSVLSMYLLNQCSLNYSFVYKVFIFTLHSFI